MRTRALVGIVLLALPTVSSAQVVTRLPRPGERAPGDAGSSPPAEIPAVARDLSAKRARWSVEGYSLTSVVQTTSAPGDIAYLTFGIGTHGDYRVTRRMSATADMTYSPLGVSGVSQTAEVGTRFTPLPSHGQLRPYFDLRAAYLQSTDRFVGTLGNSGGIDGAAAQQRCSRGFGAVGGVGMEVSVNPNAAVTFGGTAMRNRMNVYRSASPTDMPVGVRYWATVFRFALGFRFHPATNSSLTQNPMQ